MRQVIRITTPTVLLATCLTAGCSVTGKKFTPLRVPDGKAVVYIYRNSSTLGGAVSWELFANDEHITQIVNGGYYAHVATPGKIEYKELRNISIVMTSMFIVNRLLRDKNPLYTLEATAGKEYFLNWESTLMFRPELMQVPKDRALQDLREMRKFGDTREQDPIAKSK